MRQLSSLLRLGLAAVLGTACGGSAVESEAVVPTGEFRVLVPARPTTLNPNLELDEISNVVGRNIFSQLLALNESGRLLPELAQSWHTSADGRTYTFTLRPNVRWHDGVALTSADVRWTLETIAKDGVAQQALAPVESIETPDRATVVVRLKYPWAPFASDLAAFGVAMLPRHLYEGRDWRSHPANQAPVGTGPFRFSRWADPDTLVLEANRDYFRSGPYVARLIFSAVPEEAVVQKLLAAEADLSLTTPLDLDFRTPPPAPLSFQSLPSSGRTYLAMNLRRAPFNDVRVRRAIAASIDRLEIIRDAMDGLGAPAVGWYTPDVEWAYNAEARVPDQDEREAMRLLDAAGLRRRARRMRFEATLVTPRMGAYPAIADRLQTQLARVGIDVAIERLAFPEFAQRVLTAGEFDLALMGGTQGPDPDALRTRFLVDTETGAYIGYDNPAFRDAVERGARTLEYAARAEAYYGAQGVLAADVPFVPLAEHVKVVVYNRRVTGLPQLEARGLVGAFDFSLVKVGGSSDEAPR